LKHIYAKMIILTLVLSILSIAFVVPASANGPIEHTKIQTGFTVDPNHSGTLIAKGSTIHHLTTGEVDIIGADGSINMIALQSQSNFVMTPFGVKKADTVYDIPDGAHIVPSADGHITKVLDENRQLIFTVIDDQTLSQIPAQQNGNIIGTTYYTSASQFGGYFRVPAPPQNTSDADYYWIGVQKGSCLGQTVLQWNQPGYSQEWTIANWANSGYGYYHGNMPQVFQNDVINSQLVYNASYSEWYVQGQDVTTGITASTAYVANMGETGDTIITSLETYNSLGQVVYTPADMPGSEYFYFLTLYLANGNYHSISWTLYNPYHIPTSTVQLTYDSNGDWVTYNTYH
jgi:hypothetical protein